MLPTDKQARKERPMARGLLDYFGDALAEVAYVSYHGNAQHNPDQPMHWARGKSDDHADCLLRHLAERGTLDDDGLRHSAKVAWRALALLQIELEEAADAGVDAGAERQAEAKSKIQHDDLVYYGTDARTEVEKGPHYTSGDAVPFQKDSTGKWIPFDEQLQRLNQSTATVFRDDQNQWMVLTCSDFTDYHQTFEAALAEAVRMGII